MAIGSAPEIGTKFTRIPVLDGMLDHDALVAYWKVWKQECGPDMLRGWASLHYAPRYSDGIIPETVQSPTTREP